MKKHIEVVAAVIKKGDKYFCAQRKAAGKFTKKEKIKTILEC